MIYRILSGMVILIICGIFIPVGHQSKPEKLSFGDLAPEFRLSDIKDQEISLSTYADKALLIYFWADYCQRCRRHISKMQELRQRYDGRDFEIIAVNVAQSKTHIQKIVSEYGATFPVALDTDQKAADAYNVRSLPTTFVVDKDRRIIKKKEGFMDGKELNAILLKLVNTPENI